MEDSHFTQAKKRILLVEDEFYLRDIYTLVLTKAGFTIDPAMNGEEGLAKAQTKPDMILLDIMLPLLNGLEVLKKLKQDPSTKDIPVVLITNLGQKDIIEQAFRDGAQGFILKVQVKPHDLVSLVTHFLQNPLYRMDPSTLAFD